MSVRRSVGLSVGRSVSSNFRSRISLFRGLQRLSTAPAQPHATEIAVYTALFYGNASILGVILVILDIERGHLRSKKCAVGSLDVNEIV